jgi:hypothetical protein
MNDDLLSVSMFWAGALMVFTPIILAAVVVGIWWHQRRRAATERGERREDAPTR